MSDFDIASSVETFVREWLYEMNRDEIGIGLGGVIDCGRRSHHLEAENLAAFVHGVILGLAEGGATPQDDRFVTPDNPFGLAYFGSDTPREVADGIVAEWVAPGMPAVDWDAWCMDMAPNRARLAGVMTAWAEFVDRWKRSNPETRP